MKAKVPSKRLMAGNMPMKGATSSLPVVPLMLSWKHLETGDGYAGYVNRKCSVESVTLKPYESEDPTDMETFFFTVHRVTCITSYSSIAGAWPDEPEPSKNQH